MTRPMTLLRWMMRRRRYDIPLGQRSGGGGFVLLMVGLMTFLATLATAGALILSDMKQRWSEGIATSLTIEIPAEAPNGQILPPDRVTDLADAVVAALTQDQSIVQSARRMDADEVAALLSPWLGADGTVLSALPLPALIAVTTHAPPTEADIAALRSRMASVSTSAILETHESWLVDLIRFTRGLGWIALFLVGVAGTSLVLAVDGAIRAQMAIHHGDVEILHLMGAPDGYIIRQIARHTFLTALQGALIGAVVATGLVVALPVLSRAADPELMPSLHLTWRHFLILGGVPLAAAILGMVSSIRASSSALSRMP